MDIKYSKQAIKFLNAQTFTVKRRIVAAISGLPVGDVKRLKGRDGYRLRVGDFRVLFDRDGNIIYISKIDNRGQIYK